jgi:hypothetical protein
MDVQRSPYRYRALRIAPAIKKEGEIIGKIEQHENLLAHA